MILRLLLSKQNKFCMVCLFVVFLCLSLLSCGSEPPADVTDPGHRLFLGYTKKDVNCSRCHAPDGKGSDDGPDLTKVLQKYDEDRIAEIIEEGKGLGEDSMPPFIDKLTAEEVDLLIGHIKSIQKK